MKKLSLAIVFSIIIASPSFAKEIIADWVKGKTGIDWKATPKDYPDRVTSKDTILWVGVIEEVAVYSNDQKETVIEFLCRHLSLEQIGSEGLHAWGQHAWGQACMGSGFQVVKLRYSGDIM